jgi:hypothetical protein
MRDTIAVACSPFWLRQNLPASDLSNHFVQLLEARAMRKTLLVLLCWPRKPLRGAIVVVALALCFAAVRTAHAQASVTTYHNDNLRSGVNPNETVLTPATVNVNQFGELYSQVVDGLIVAQPLYLSGVNILNGGTHNVVYVATQHDSVYAFDADNNAGTNSVPLWQVSFAGANGVTSVPIANQSCGSTTKFTEIGIVGTPVIDPITGTLYVVAKTLENGTFVHRLHALDVTSGAEKFGGPIVIQASVVYNGKTIYFNDQHQMQRPALLLSNGVVYIAFGTLGCKYYPPSVGWLIAYDAASLQQLAVFNTAPTQKAGAGIWQSGFGPAADDDGDVYFATADGQFDVNSGGADYGDSLLKIALGAQGFTVSDYFTPFNQSNLNLQDLDLGSTGPILLPDQPSGDTHLLVLAGKAGMVYLANRDNLGGYNPAADTQMQQELGYGAEIDGGLAFWNNLLYVTGSALPLSAYSLSNGALSLTPVARTTFGGGIIAMSISSNGASGGIVWILKRSTTSTPTTNLYALNATNLKQLYRTQQAPTRDALGVTAHFAVPTIANGKVYVGANQQLFVLGLLSAKAASPGTLGGFRAP